MSARPECPYCFVLAEITQGSEIYPHRPDLFPLWFWICRECGAYTGTHKDSKDRKPKGGLANKALRLARIDAHGAFDLLWKEGEMSRSEAYVWLKRQVAAGETHHIGFMDIIQCRQVVRICEYYTGKEI